MAEWTLGCIGELASGIRGVSYTPLQLCERMTDSTVMLLRSNNIQDGNLIFDSVHVVQDRAVSNVQLMQEGDVAVCMSNGSKDLVGKSASLDTASGERLTVGAFCSIFRPRQGANKRFVKYVFQSSAYRRQLDLSLAGSAINNLRNAAIESFEVGLPPFNQQTRIACVLDTFDTAIRQTEAIIAKLKQVKQGLLHDLLTRGINANGELRPPQSQAPHLYKPSPLGWIPKEWDVLKLAEISSSVTSGSRDWARFYSEDGALFVRIGNLTRDHINLRWDSRMYVRPPERGDGQRTRLETGDLLISITADLGIIGVVPTGLGEAYINQHIAMVRIMGDRANSRFVGHYLAAQPTQAHILTLNDAGAKAGLNLPTIRNLMTVIPARTEQDEIARRLDDADARIDSGMTELAKLGKLKSGLMDDLLTGRVRVTSLLEAAATP